MSFNSIFKKLNRVDIATVSLPLGICFILSIPLFGWIIDDAGISFVYSRNLAEGNGLVSQPGLSPVEGYSNPLWIFILAPFFALGLFHPFIVPKVFGLLLVGTTFYFIHKSAQILTGTKYVVSLIVLLFLSANASFVIWTSSGLENALFSALISILLYLTIRTDWSGLNSKKEIGIIGFIAALIALTRPDGLVYAVIFPFAALLHARPLKKDGLAKLSKTLSWYLASFTIVFGTYFLFRIIYFGEILPNTYYAKGGPTWSGVWRALVMEQTYLNKLQEILSTFFGAKLWLLIPILFAAWLVSIAIKRKPDKKELVLVFLVFLSGFTYLIVINDWMGEYRLATPFFVLLYLFFGLVASQIARLIRLNTRLKVLTAAIIIVLIAGVSFSIHSKRISEFAEISPVSFASVADRFGHRFNQIADSLGIENASFLVPDVGGTLYYSKLRIVDLAGLCDPVIARTMQKDRPRFLDYVFEEVKPTFIHTHGWFTTTARFHEDPRFVRDYTPFWEYEDKFASDRLKKKIMSGHYIRKDAAKPLPTN